MSKHGLANHLGSETQAVAPNPYVVLGIQAGCTGEVYRTTGLIRSQQKRHYRIRCQPLQHAEKATEKKTRKGSVAFVTTKHVEQSKFQDLKLWIAGWCSRRGCQESLPQPCTAMPPRQAPTRGFSDCQKLPGSILITNLEFALPRSQ